MTVIRIKAQKVTFILLVFAGLLILASISGQLIKLYTGHDFAYGLIPAFDLDGEQNIPSYFSSIILLYSALLFGIIALSKRTKPYFYHWFTLTLVVIYLSIDELVCIHESWTEPMRMLFSTKGFLYYAWIIPAILGAVVFLICFRKFFLHLPSKTKRFLGIAIILYVGGGVGLEFIGGWISSLYGEKNLAIIIESTFEETLEMLGVIVLTYGLLDYLRSEVKGALLRIE